MPGIFFTVKFARFSLCSCDMSLHRAARSGHKRAGSVAMGKMCHYICGILSYYPNRLCDR